MCPSLTAVVLLLCLASSLAVSRDNSQGAVCRYMRTTQDGRHSWCVGLRADPSALVTARLYLRGASNSLTNSSDMCSVARRCHSFALDAATPSSPRFRQFASLDDVRRMVGASPRAASSTVEWLVAQDGMSPSMVVLSPLQNAVDVVAPVAVLERLFAAPAGLMYRTHALVSKPDCRVTRAAPDRHSATFVAPAIPTAIQAHVYAVRHVADLPPAELCAAKTSRRSANAKRVPSTTPVDSSFVCHHAFGMPSSGPSMCAQNLREAVSMSEIATAAEDTPVYIAVYERASNYDPSGVAESNAIQGLGAPKFKPQPTWVADPAAQERNNASKCHGVHGFEFEESCGEASLDMQIIGALTNGSIPSMYVGQNINHGALDCSRLGLSIVFFLWWGGGGGGGWLARN